MKPCATPQKGAAPQRPYRRRVIRLRRADAGAVVIVEVRVAGASKAGNKPAHCAATMQMPAKKTSGARPGGDSRKPKQQAACGKPVNRAGKTRMEADLHRRKRDRRSFSEFPTLSQERALLRKRALAAYFESVKGGAEKQEAERVAQSIWVRAMGKAVTGRQVRRWISVINAHGGIGVAPDTAYLDGKSCRHRRKRRK